MSQQITRQLIKELHANWLFFFPDWNKRIAAAKQLGKVEVRAIEAVPELRRVIKQSENRDLCRAAVEALGQIGGAEAVTALAKLLSARFDLHSIIVQALLEIGDESAIIALINGYESAPEGIKNALSELKSTHTAKPLITALAHNSDTIQALAMNLLVASADFIQPLIAALGDQNSDIREKAGELLTQQGQNAVPVLIIALSDENSGVQRGASEVLARIGANKTVKPLLRVLEEGDERPASAATRALAQIGKPAVKPLIERLASQNKETSRRAGAALAQIGESAVKPLITASAAHPQAVDILVRMKEVVQRTLRAASRNDVRLLMTALELPNEELRQSASEGLVAIGAPVVPALIEVAASGEAPKSQVAIKTLGQIGEPTVGLLIKKLTNKSQRAMAMKVITLVGEPALPTLFAALDSDNETLCQLIIDQMCAITNMDRETLAIRQYAASYHCIQPFKTEYTLIKYVQGEKISFIEQAISTDNIQEGIALQEFCGKDKMHLLYDERGSLWEADGPPNMARATIHLQRIQKIDPNLGIPSYWLGIWHMIRQESNQAIPHFETALSRRLWPKGRRGKCHWWLGFAYTFYNNSIYEDAFLYNGSPDSIRYDEAMPHFEQALKSDYSDLQFYREIYQGICTCTMRAEAAYLESGAELETVMQTIEKKREIAQMWIEYNPEEAQLARNILEYAQSQLSQADDMRDEPQAFIHELRHSRAKGLINKGRFERAIKLLEALLAEKPQDNGLRSFLATVHVKGGSVPKGIAILKQAVKNEPGRITHFTQDIMNIEPHRNRFDGFIDNLIAQKQYDKALAFLDECAELIEIPDPEKGPQLIGVCHGIMGYRYNKVAEASNDLRAHSEALRHNQLSYDLLPIPEGAYNLARSHREMFIYYAQQGNLGQALPYLHKSVEVDPTFVDGWRRLGIVYTEQKRFKEASSCFLTCVELEPKDGQLWFGLGLALLGARDTENAVQAISRATELGNPHAIKWMREALNR